MTAESIIPQGRLAALLEHGYSLTYVGEVTGGYFADLRDASGRVAETGLGRTRAEAAVHLAGRLERAEAAPAQAAATLEGMIAAHVAEGFEVLFTATNAGDFWAHLDKADDPDAGCTAGGKTPREALWAASPLHGDDEPMPAARRLDPEIAEFVKDLKSAGEIAGLERDINGLSAEMSDVFDRLDALEGQRRDMSVLIFALGDLMARAFPGGYSARGGKPAARCHRHPERPYGACPECDAEIDAAIARDKAALAAAKD